jgi:RNA polymerase sigma-70 factor (ECF subfamily)
MRLHRKGEDERVRPGAAGKRATPEGPTDEALMQQFQQGNSEAFAVLMSRHRPGVFNFLLRHVGNPSVAEDLLQDAFLRVVQSADRYKLECKFTTWLYTIARNLCVDQARKMKFRRHASLNQPKGSSEGPDLGERIPDKRAATDRAAIGSELQIKITEAIGKLTEEQREVFLMREYAHLPFKEIAEIVGVPENTVKSRMRYALEHLRKSLAEYQDYVGTLV